MSVLYNKLDSSWIFDHDKHRWLQTVADAVQQTTKLLEEAKPIASSAVETISSADPTVIVGTAGALFVAYLIVPPIWSAISFSFRGYQGNLLLYFV